MELELYQVYNSERDKYALRTLYCWGIRGEALFPQEFGPVRDDKLNFLNSRGGTGRFFLGRGGGGDSEKRLSYLIRLCQQMKIKCDFGGCSLTNKGCWNERYMVRDHYTRGQESSAVDIDSDRYPTENIYEYQKLEKQEQDAWARTSELIDSYTTP